MAKVTIMKATAEGEQIQVEVPAIPMGVLSQYDKNPHILSVYLAPYFRLVDDRLWEMNKRIAAMNARLRKAAPEVGLIVQEIHALLYGQVPPQDIDKMIEQDKTAREAEMAKPEVAAQVQAVEERLAAAGAPTVVVDNTEDEDEAGDEDDSLGEKESV